MLYDKRALYTKLEDKLSGSELRYEFPLDIRALVREEAIEVQYYPFDSEAIGAVLVKGEQKSGILVNSNKPAAEQRFDLAHELIHFWFHPTRTSFSFQNPQSRDRGTKNGRQTKAPPNSFCPIPILSRDLFRLRGMLKKITSRRRKSIPLWQDFTGFCPLSWITGPEISNRKSCNI